MLIIQGNFFPQLFSSINKQSLEYFLGKYSHKGPVVIDKTSNKKYISYIYISPKLSSQLPLISTLFCKIKSWHLVTSKWTHLLKAIIFKVFVVHYFSELVNLNYLGQQSA